MEKKTVKKYINMYQSIFKFLNVNFKAFKDEMNMKSTKTEAAPHESMEEKMKFLCDGRSLRGGVTEIHF